MIHNLKGMTEAQLKIIIATYGKRKTFYKEGDFALFTLEKEEIGEKFVNTMVINKFGSDLKCLAPEQWLSGPVIQFYMNAMHELRDTLDEVIILSLYH